MENYKSFAFFILTMATIFEIILFVKCGFYLCEKEEGNFFKYLFCMFTACLMVVIQIISTLILHKLYSI